MIDTQYITLNMTPSGVLPTLHCSQYDIGRPLGLVVYNGSEAVDLDTYTCTIEATRTDGTAITAAVTTSDNVGAFATTATMTNVADKYDAQLVLFDSNSNRVASLPFIMRIIPAAMDENAESIEEDQSLYQQYTGTVQTLIADIHEKLNQLYHDTVAEMVADTTLTSGAYVRTGGYHSVNDGGGSLYRISGTASSTHYETLENGLYAVLIPGNAVTPEMFGAYADGSTDDSNAFTNAVASKKTILLKNGAIYNVGNCVISDKNGLSIIGDATLKGQIEFNNCTHVVLRDCTFDGDYMWYVRPYSNASGFDQYLTDRANAPFQLHIKYCSFVVCENVTSQHGIQGFSINESSNVACKNCKAFECMADGFYVSDNSKNILIDNCISEKVNDDCFATYTAVATECCENVTFRNCKGVDSFGALVTLGNVKNGLADNCYGLRLHYFGFKTAGSATGIKSDGVLIQNCHVDYDTVAELDGTHNSNGSITIAFGTENSGTGVVLQMCSLSMPNNNQVINARNTNDKDVILEDVQFNFGNIGLWNGNYTVRKCTFANKLTLQNCNGQLAENDFNGSDYGVHVIGCSDIVFSKNKYTKGIKFDALNGTINTNLTVDTYDVTNAREYTDGLKYIIDDYKNIEIVSDNGLIEINSSARFGNDAFLTFEFTPSQDLTIGDVAFKVSNMMDVPKQRARGLLYYIVTGIPECVIYKNNVYNNEFPITHGSLVSGRKYAIEMHYRTKY